MFVKGIVYMTIVDVFCVRNSLSIHVMKWSWMLVDVFVIEMRWITLSLSLSLSHTHTHTHTHTQTQFSFHPLCRLYVTMHIIICRHQYGTVQIHDMWVSHCFVMCSADTVNWITCVWVQLLYVGLECQGTNWSVAGHPDCYPRMKIRMISITLCDNRCCRNGSLKFYADRLDKSWECILCVL